MRLDVWAFCICEEVIFFIAINIWEYWRNEWFLDYSILPSCFMSLWITLRYRAMGLGMIRYANLYRGCEVVRRSHDTTDILENASYYHELQIVGPRSLLLARYSMITIRVIAVRALGWDYYTYESELIIVFHFTHTVGQSRIRTLRNS